MLCFFPSDLYCPQVLVISYSTSVSSSASFPVTSNTCHSEAGHTNIKKMEILWTENACTIMDHMYEGIHVLVSSLGSTGWCRMGEESRYEDYQIWQSKPADTFNSEERGLVVSIMSVYGILSSPAQFTAPNRRPISMHKYFRPRLSAGAEQGVHKYSQVLQLGGKGQALRHGVGEWWRWSSRWSSGNTELHGAAMF